VHHPTHPTSLSLPSRSIRLAGCPPAFGKNTATGGVFNVVAAPPPAAKMGSCHWAVRPTSKKKGRDQGQGKPRSPSSCLPARESGISPPGHAGTNTSPQTCRKALGRGPHHRGGCTRGPASLLRARPKDRRVVPANQHHASPLPLHIRIPFLGHGTALQLSSMWAGAPPHSTALTSSAEKPSRPSPSSFRRSPLRLHLCQCGGITAQQFLVCHGIWMIAQKHPEPVFYRTFRQRFSVRCFKTTPTYARFLPC
jgi:hypothetical protein